MANSDTSKQTETKIPVRFVYGISEADALQKSAGEQNKLCFYFTNESSIVINGAAFKQSTGNAGGGGDLEAQEVIAPALTDLKKTQDTSTYVSAMALSEQHYRLQELQTDVDQLKQDIEALELPHPPVPCPAPEDGDNLK